MNAESGSTVFESESEDLKEIENLIAQTHGFYVSHDDPILILYTMNKFIMQQNVKVLSSNFKVFKEEMAIEAMKWSESSNNTADRFLLMSIKAQEKSMDDFLQKVTSKIVLEIEARFKLIEQQEKSFLQPLKIGIFMSFIASFITLASVTLIFF